MVLPQQVEDTVDQKPVEFLILANAVSLGIGPHRAETDDHVAKHPRLLGRHAGKTFVVLLDKGKDVCGTVDIAVLLVQLVDGVVVDKGDGKLHRGIDPQRIENPV